jgi:DNA-binding NtrC family response regulator
MSDSDKQMIIKAILDLKQEVDRLKEAVQTGAPVQQPVPNALPHYVDMAADEPDEQLSEPEAAPEGISIRKMGDELIEHALAKHGGKVKSAAAELGISERTIYRKLADWKTNGKKA